MPYLHTARMRPSLLALAIVCSLHGAAYAAVEDMTVTATGNARSAFEAPMMVSVIDATAPENQTASSAADLLRRVPGLTLDGTGRTNGQTSICAATTDAACWYWLTASVKALTPDTSTAPSSILPSSSVLKWCAARPRCCTAAARWAASLPMRRRMPAIYWAREKQRVSRVRYRCHGDHSLGMGASTYGRTDTLDGLLSGQP